MNEREIFAAALQKSSDADRQTYLDEVCAGDAEMRDRIDLLLIERSRLGSFMEHPAIEGLGTELFSGAEPPTATTDTRTVLQLRDSSLAFLEPSDDPKSLGRIGQ